MVHLTFDECLSLSHAHGVEIYNHSCHIEAQRGFGTAQQIIYYKKIIKYF